MSVDDLVAWSFDDLVAWMEALLDAPLDISPSTRLGLDSLEFVILLDALETELGVDVPTSYLPFFETYGDVYDHCKLRWDQATSSYQPLAPSQAGVSDDSNDDLVARLSGRTVRLRPIAPADYSRLYEIFTDAENIIRFRLTGTTPSPESFPQFLWAGVFAQFMVVSTDTGREIGLVNAYNADYRNGLAYISIVMDPKAWRFGFGIEAVLLMVNYVFHNFPFRKLYFETLGPNYERFASGANVLFEVEGRLRAHCFVGGRYADLLTLAIYREGWSFPQLPGELARLTRMRERPTSSG